MALFVCLLLPGTLDNRKRMSCLGTIRKRGGTKDLISKERQDNPKT